jgi:hypothetical protein
MLLLLLRMTTTMTLLPAAVSDAAADIIMLRGRRWLGGFKPFNPNFSGASGKHFEPESGFYFLSSTAATTARSLNRGDAINRFSVH